MLDIMSGGRFIFGVAIGYRADEFALFGAPLEKRGARMAEAIDLMRRLWTEEEVTHHGPRYHADQLLLDQDQREGEKSLGRFESLFESAQRRALPKQGGGVASRKARELVAEVVSRGLLADVTLPEAAALCSALSEEARSGEPALARVFLRSRPKLRRRLDQIAAVAETVAEAQRHRRLGMPVSVQPGFMPAVYRWASGDADWQAIVQDAFGGHEGDLIRAMRRLIDVLRQLGENAEVPPATARLLLQAARMIDRDIVLESALI